MPGSCEGGTTRAPEDVATFCKEIGLQMRSAMQLKTRVVQAVAYPDCFLGSKATTWLQEHLGTSNRDEAVQVAQQLIAHDVIYEAVNSDPIFRVRHATRSHYCNYCCETHLCLSLSISRFLCRMT